MHRNAWMCGLLVVALGGPVVAADSWPQWGGPGRDFTLEARELSREWGKDGPPELWSRDLGGGFSSIISDGRQLYTMFRVGDEEVVIALDQETGKTKWEHRYSAPIPKGGPPSTRYGSGPNSTPLLVDGKLVTLGFTGKLHCIQAANGKVAWFHDMGDEFKVETPYFGHSASPLALGQRVVVVAGGVFAFDLGSGTVAWRNEEFQGTYGSPQLVSADGRDQIVTPMVGHLIGVDAASGKTLWVEEFNNQWSTILTSPLLDDQGRVFISTSEVGSMLVDPSTKRAATRKVWKAGKTQISYSNAVRQGEWVFASTGESASFITATSLKDGAQAWKERGFAGANLIRVGNEYLLLDYDAVLALVELDRKGMTVVTKSSIGEKRTWTPPTLVGTSLFVRDDYRIRALDLAKH